MQVAAASTLSVIASSIFGTVVDPTSTATATATTMLPTTTKTNALTTAPTWTPTPVPGSGADLGAGAGSAGPSYEQKLMIALSVGIVSIVCFISALTYFSLKRIPKIPPKDHARE